MEWFVDAEINQNALNDFFEGMNRSKFEVHTMQIYRGDRRILRLAQEPYSCTDPREVYSLSKMFTSTVVGIAVDHGLVRTEDRLVDIFGRKNASEKMSHMTLKNLLSMNTGHDRCVLPEMEAARDSVEAFFGVEPLYEPGTHFTYNTGASCLLGSVVERVSGRDFFDYACENLFYPLGITDVSWRRCADGRCYGGTGLYASNDDIMKLGRMYKNGGVYHGRRILSSEWIAEASSYVSDNSSNGTLDWCSGYGYQIWLNSRGGYRGDGAFGQLCSILPGRDLVVAIQAMGGDMQRELDYIFTFLDRMDGGNNSGGKVFSFAPLPAGEIIPQMDEIFVLDENQANFHSARIKAGGNSLQLSFSDGQSIQTVSARSGCWTMNTCSMQHMQPCLIGHLPTEGRETLAMAVCCSQEGNKTVLDVRYRTSPHRERWEITVEDGKFSIAFAEPDGCLFRPENMRKLTGHKR